MYGCVYFVVLCNSVDKTHNEKLPLKQMEILSKLRSNPSGGVLKGSKHRDRTQAQGPRQLWGPAPALGPFSAPPQELLSNFESIFMYWQLVLLSAPLKQKSFYGDPGSRILMTKTKQTWPYHLHV